MPISLVILIAVFYALLLFIIAWWSERRSARGKKSLVNNPYVYSLSLAVYCTAWTFFGSVGKAADSGIDFLPIYLGPTIAAIIWWLVLRKMIFISKSQRITSIADFISSRYGKSTFLGATATLIALIAVIPYISIQLKAVAVSFNILVGKSGDAGLYRNIPFFQDSAWYIAIVLAVFTLLFGTRKLDPNERHEGLVAAVAFESIFKLVAFLIVGIFVTYGIFDGFSDIFSQASNQESLQKVLFPVEHGLNGTYWFWLVILSVFAILFLPRQFHLAVVENNNPNFVRKAAWIFPLYLLLINIFVLPIALGGVLRYGELVSPDTFVLHFPLAEGYPIAALLIAVGGFSAATGMVIVAVTALSIMIGNNIVVPTLLRSGTIHDQEVLDISERLLSIRRISVVVVLILAYGYFKFVASQYSLVSIGLISFAGIAQFAPATLGGMYWKRATSHGAGAGLIVGALIWAFCLPLPTLAEAGLLSKNILHEGLLGWEILRPYQLFGLEGWDRISHGTFWSLLFNCCTYVIVSLFTQPKPSEILQADIFVNIHKYLGTGIEFEVMRRRAKMEDIRNLLFRFLGAEKGDSILKEYARNKKGDIKIDKNASEELIAITENHLTGAIGAASAKVIINSVAKEDPIGLEEMFSILDRTQEIVKYSKDLEQKSQELEESTKSLRAANDQLKELDRLKADFITTVTHELRTPITSIKSLTNILLDNPSLPPNQQSEYLKIVVSESERVARLVNEVLDYEKLRSAEKSPNLATVNFTEIVRTAYRSMQSIFEENEIKHICQIPEQEVLVKGSHDRLMQAVVNLLSNARKFCASPGGRIEIQLLIDSSTALLTVKDNGVGINPENRELIFEKFAQVTDQQHGKPKGSGLGLPITREIIERHQGKVELLADRRDGTVFCISLPLIKK